MSIAVCQVTRKRHERLVIGEGSNKVHRNSKTVGFYERLIWPRVAMLADTLICGGLLLYILIRLKDCLEYKYMCALLW